MINKTQNIFKVGKKYLYIGDNFKKWFSNMEVEKADTKLYSKKLERDMNDKEILAEFKPTKITLGEINNHLDSMDKSFFGLFYIKDNAGVLRSVSVCWVGDGWYVLAHSVEDPLEWNADSQVFSRNSFETLASEPLTISSLDPIQDAINTLKNAGFTITKTY